MKRLQEMKKELEYMAEREAMKLWRIARRAEKKGCSAQLVKEIREEGSWCYNTAKVHPDRLLHWRFEYDFKYAFKM